MYEIIQKFISNNRSHKPLIVKGAVIHETATPSATAETEFNYFNSAYRAASAHCFIDDKEIIQTIPFDEVAWGSGPTSNNQFWQIEMCRPGRYDMAYFEEVWNRAVWLFAKLFKEHGIEEVTKDNLMSHAEVSAKWHETTHQDPVSYFNEYGKTVDEFRNAVQAQLKGVVHVKNLIIFSGDGDKEAANILRDNISGYITSRATYQDNPIIADNIFVVGGTWVPDNTNALLLAGGPDTDRFETAEAVCRFIREGK
jgi:N-acetylmuramoyl-L-alanine amidase